MTTKTSKLSGRQRTGRKRSDGEGSTPVLRGDGRWTAAVTLPTGGRKYVYGKAEKEVIAKRDALRRKIEHGQPITDARLTLGQYLDSWLRDVIQPTRARSTFEDYSQIVKNHIGPELGTLKLEQITPRRIQQLLNDKRAAGLSPRTCGYIHAVLRSAFSTAFKWQMITWNPAKAATPPRDSRKEVRALTATEATAITEAFKGHPLDALVTTTLALGLRQGEVLALRWRDIDLDKGILVVRHQVDKINGTWVFTDLKTASSRRTLPLPKFVITALRAQRTRVLEAQIARRDWADLDLVFPNPKGQPRNGPAVTHEFQRQLKDAALPRMKFHELRHGAATLLLARGVPLRTIQEILGHSTYTITANLYAHVAPQLKQDAADEMDAIFGVR